jgi:hypothetical protein
LSLLGAARPDRPPAPHASAFGHWIGADPRPYGRRRLDAGPAGGSLAVTGAISGTVTGISSRGLGCTLNQGAVYDDFGGKSYSFDWGAITSGTTTSFPGRLTSNGSVSGGAYGLLNNLIDGGGWEASSGTLTITGTSPAEQVSGDLTMVGRSDGSQVQAKGSFTC